MLYSSQVIRPLAAKPNKPCYKLLTSFGLLEANLASALKESLDKGKFTLKAVTLLAYKAFQERNPSGLSRVRSCFFFFPSSTDPLEPEETLTCAPSFWAVLFSVCWCAGETCCITQGATAWHEQTQEKKKKEKTGALWFTEWEYFNESANNPTHMRIFGGSC